MTLTSDKDTVATQGDTLRYELTVTNLGLGTAFDVVVTDTLPDFVSPFDFSIAPDSVNGQIIQWQVDSLGIEGSAIFVFTAAVDVLPADTTLFLISNGLVVAANDTVASNNAAADTVVARPRVVPPANYDLVLTLTSDKDTVATQGDTLRYELTVTNLGLGTAFDISLTDTLPNFVSPFDFSIAPDSVNGQIIQCK